MEFKVGDIAVSQHYYAFRRGKPYKILNIQTDGNNRECYFIQFEDGYIDWFPISDAENHQMKLVSEILV